MICHGSRLLRGTGGANQPSFLMRWQEADLTHLPQAWWTGLPRGIIASGRGQLSGGEFGGVVLGLSVAVLLY